MAAGPFRYPFDIQSTLEPWRHQLGPDFDHVVATMADRDRALEDYVDRVIYDRVSQLVTFGGGETINLGAWATWSPVVTQGVTPAQSASTKTYFVAGKLAIFIAQVDFTGTGTLGNAITITGFPFSLAHIVGSFRFFDQGNTNFVGTVIGASATTAQLFVQGDGNAMGVTGTSIPIENADSLQFVCICQVS